MGAIRLDVADEVDDEVDGVVGLEEREREHSEKNEVLDELVRVDDEGGIVVADVMLTDIYDEIDEDDIILILAEYEYIIDDDEVEGQEVLVLAEVIERGGDVVVVDEVEWDDSIVVEIDWLSVDDDVEYL